MYLQQGRKDKKGHREADRVIKKTFVTDLTKKVKNTISHYGMIEKGDRLLVAVSGGADSACLLRIFSDIGPALGVYVCAGNLDHALRGKESESESDFVRGLSRELGIPCISEKLRRGKVKKRKLSLEEDLRQKRYEFLVKTARENNCGLIATGHTMDDQAETVLMRCVKGSSSEGLSGIPPVRREREIMVIRPLIRTARSEIIEYLRLTGTAFVEDPSNHDKRFLRNRLRHEIFPLLESINPRVKRSMANLADSVRDDMSLLGEMKRRIRDTRSGTLHAGVDLRISDVILQPKSLRKEIFKDIFSASGGNVKKLTFRHWMEFEALIRSGEEGRALDLPGKVRVSRKNGALVFYKKDRRVC